MGVSDGFTGSLQIDNVGGPSVLNAQSIEIGYLQGSSGTVTVTGAGSALNACGSMSAILAGATGR